MNSLEPAFKFYFESVIGFPLISLIAQWSTIWALNKHKPFQAIIFAVLSVLATYLSLAFVIFLIPYESLSGGFRKGDLALQNLGIFLATILVLAAAEYHLLQTLSGTIKRPLKPFIFLTIAISFNLPSAFLLELLIRNL